MIKRIFFLTSLLFFASSFADNMTEEEFNSLAAQLSTNLVYASSYADDVNLQAHALENGIESLLWNATGYYTSQPDNPYYHGYYVASQEAYNRVGSRAETILDLTDSIKQQIILAQNTLNSMRFVSSTNCTELVELVRQFKHDFNAYKAKAETFLDYANDIQQYFRKFYELAYDRLKVPDSDLSSQLNMMWGELIYNISNIVSDASHYTVVDSLANITPDGTDVRLSNEGLISAANLAVNERSYLTLVDINNKLDHVGTNSTDLTWITNYLNTIQQPFFQLVKDYNRRVGTPILMTSSHYTAISNFFAALRRPFYQTEFTRAAAGYRNSPSGTNVLVRIENALYGLYGAWDEKVEFADGQDEDTLNNNLDEENITRQLDYSTNAIPEFVSNVAGLSNGWNRISAKFKSAIDSFLFDSGSDSGYYEMVRLTPEYELGGIEVPYFHFTLDQSIGNGIRLFFTAFWYIIFAALFFKLFMMLFYLLGRFIAHTVLVVSTLLS